jgi:serine/threonine protein kinase
MFYVELLTTFGSMVTDDCRGKFSIVKEAVEIATSKPCALKIMKKSVVQDNNLVKEVEIMRQLKHPNVISLQDIYETDADLILVLELYVLAYVA